MKEVPHRTPTPGRTAARTAAQLLLLVSTMLALACAREARYYLERGEELLREDRHAEAAINFERAAQIDPKSAEAWRGLARSHRERGRPAEAYRALVRAVEAAPQDASLKVELGELALEAYAADPQRPQFLYDQLKKLAAELLAADPNSVPGLRFQGALALFDKQPKAAIATLERALALEPDDPQVAALLVQALFEDGRGNQAEKVAREAIRRRPEFPGLYNLLYARLLAERRLGAAEEILRLKTEKNPANSNYRLELATHYAETGQTGKMEATLRSLTEDLRTFPRGYFEVGDFRARRRDWAGARQAYEAGMAAQPERRLDYRKRLLDLEIMQGRREAALALAGEILKEAPGDPEVRRSRARLLASGSAEELDTAIGEFTALAKARPAEAGLRVDLGTALLQKGAFEDARKQLAEAVRLDTQNLEARLRLAQASLGARRFVEALEQAELLIAIEPEDARAILLHAMALAGLGRYAEARTDLARLSQRFPGSPEVQLQLALVALQEGKVAEAETLLGRLAARSSPGDPRAGIALAEVYLLRNQFERARKVLEEEMKRAPAEAPRLRRVLGLAALRAGRPELAVEQYEILAAGGGLADLLRLGEAHLLRGDPAAAIAVFEKAHRAAPDRPEVISLLADALAGAGRGDQALALYRRLLELEPDNAGALNNLAFLLAERGERLEEALRHIERALKLAPQEAAFRDTLGYVYLKRGAVDSAVQLFRGLVEAQPENASYRYHFALALIEKGEPAAARRELEAALARGLRPEEAEKAKKLLERLQ
jgi:Flp pilus assembly protein TadD